MAIPYPYKVIKRNQPEKEKIVKVKMLKDWKAAIDGNNIKDFKKGKTVDVPERFGKRWIEKEIAAKPGSRKKAKSEETKAVEEAPENK